MLSQSNTINPMSSENNLSSDSSQRAFFQHPKHMYNEREDVIANRFSRSEHMISQSKYRTIFKGLDKESGCEIAISCYRLETHEIPKCEKLLNALEEMQRIQHKYVLNVIYFEVRTNAKSE